MTNQPNIVLIVLDSLRRDRLSAFGADAAVAPTLDSLADEGTLFTDAISTGSWTVPAHGSLFTGELPSVHGAHAKNKQLSTKPEETLAGQLSESGYDTMGISANPWLKEQYGFTTGFDQFEPLTPSLPFDDAGDPNGEQWNDNDGSRLAQYGKWLFDGNPFKRMSNLVYSNFFLNHSVVDAEQVNARVSHWIDTVDGPSFLFLNYMDTHEPYQIRPDYLPSDSELSSAPDISWNLSALEPNNNQTHKENIETVYDASVRYLDEQIDELVSKLKSDDLFEETYLIICSDHGQALGEHDFWGHGMYLHDVLTRVPLLIVPPQGTDYPDKINSAVSLADVPRVVLELTGEQFDNQGPHTFSNYTSMDECTTPLPAVSESYGPQKPVSSPVINLSHSGYRSLYLGQWKVYHNLDTGEYEVDYREDVPEIAVSRDQALSELNTVEATVSPAGQNENWEAQSVEQRLNDLGYM